MSKDGKVRISVENAMHPSFDEKNKDDTPLMQQAKRLHYLAKNKHWEDAFYVAEFMVAGMFAEGLKIEENPQHNWEENEEADTDMPVICKTAALVSHLRTRPHKTSGIVCWVLGIMRQLFRNEVKCKAALENGFDDALRRCRRIEADGV